jgi:hypothetical protein
VYAVDRMVVTVVGSLPDSILAIEVKRWLRSIHEGTYLLIFEISVPSWVANPDMSGKQWKARALPLCNALQEKLAFLVKRIDQDVHRRFIVEDPGVHDALAVVGSLYSRPLLRRAGKGADSGHHGATDSLVKRVDSFFCHL